MPTRGAYEKLLAHLRAPIRQYEGGWADTALRDGGKDAKRFGTGPDANKGKEFEEDGEELLDNTHHASIRDVGRRKGKYSRADLTLPQEKVDKLVLPEESFKVEKMAMSQTDEDFVMECALVLHVPNREGLFKVLQDHGQGRWRPRRDSRLGHDLSVAMRIRAVGVVRKISRC